MALEKDARGFVREGITPKRGRPQKKTSNDKTVMASLRADEFLMIDVINETEVVTMLRIHFVFENLVLLIVLFCFRSENVRSFSDVAHFWPSHRSVVILAMTS